MRTNLLIFLLTVASIRLSAQSFVSIEGVVQNARGNTIIITIANSWLEPIVSQKSAIIDEQGKFTLTFQFDERIKPACIIYGTDTLELLLTGGESLELKADGKNFAGTLHFEGNGAPNANFCIKHSLQRGRMMLHAQKLNSLYKKNIPDFKKAIEADYKKEMDYLQKNGKDISPVLTRYWRLSYEYDKYCIMLRYPSTKIWPDVPELFKDELMIMPQYRQYAILEADRHNDLRKYPESREAELNKFLYSTMPPQTGEFAAASLVFRLISTDPKEAKAKLEEFKGHFPHSRYIPLIAVKLPG